MSEEVKSITEELIESQRKILKARFKIIKNLPEEVANSQIENDEELASHIRDILQLNFHNAFAVYGVLVMEDDDDFKIVKSDIKNKKFEYQYKGQLCASLRLIHMLTRYNKEIQDRDQEILELIDNYYVISYNIPFDFDNSGNVSKNETLSTNVNRWLKNSEFKASSIRSSDEEILDILDKYVDSAIKSLIQSLDAQINEEIAYLMEE